MYAKIAVVVIVALVGVASAANSTCNSQSEVPVLNDPTFSAYVEFDGTNTYLPLKYTGHSSGYNHPVRGISVGKAQIITDCAEINASIVVDAGNETLFYSLKWMSFSNGQSKQVCTLSPMVMKNRDAKYYSCKNAEEKSVATLVIGRVHIIDEDICQVRPTKLCKLNWVEGGQNRI